MTCVNANDDASGNFGACAINRQASRVQWPSENGVMYYLLIHGFGARSGDFQLNVINYRPLNDKCENAKDIQPGDTTIGTTFQATFPFDGDAANWCVFLVVLFCSRLFIYLFFKWIPDEDLLADTRSMFTIANNVVYIVVANSVSLENPTRYGTKPSALAERWKPPLAILEHPPALTLKFTFSKTTAILEVASEETITSILPVDAVCTNGQHLPGQCTISWYTDSLRPTGYSN